MGPRTMLGAIAAVVVAACMFVVSMLYFDIHPTDLVLLTVDSYPGDTFEAFLLYEAPGSDDVEVMKEYQGKIFQGTPFDPRHAFRKPGDPLVFRDPVGFRDPDGGLWPPLTITGSPVLIAAQWVDSRRYGVLAYTTSREWNLWWLAEDRVRRPPARGWFANPERATIQLSEKDATRISRPEALRLLGMRDSANPPDAEKGRDGHSDQ